MRLLQGAAFGLPGMKQYLPSILESLNTAVEPLALIEQAAGVCMMIHQKIVSSQILKLGTNTFYTPTKVLLSSFQIYDCSANAVCTSHALLLLPHIQYAANNYGFHYK